MIKETKYSTLTESFRAVYQQFLNKIILWQFKPFSSTGWQWNWLVIWIYVTIQWTVKSVLWRLAAVSLIREKYTVESFSKWKKLVTAEFFEYFFSTSMHSSRMRTARRLSVSGGGVCLLRDRPPWGVCLSMTLWESRPPVNRQTPVKHYPPATSQGYQLTPSNRYPTL